MAQKTPEYWLQGPIEGIPPALQPVAHALLQTADDVDRICSRFTTEDLWKEVHGTASLGFHLRHLIGATDRLFTYARGGELNEAQKAALSIEKQKDGNLPGALELISRFRETVDHALAQLRATSPDSLFEAREVGRAKMPSTVIGLLFHTAEHAQRHAGQISTTARILQQTA